MIPAITDELKDEVYRLRHSVYCDDLKWEPVRPSGLESDEYDAHSVHILLRHVATREHVGCVRIVLTRPQDPAFRLPFERVCDDKLDPTGMAFDLLPRNRVAEISRLAVISKYRRRRGEAERPAPTTKIPGTEHMPRFPYILIGLYLGVVAIARQHDVETLFVLTEPRLADHFRRLGVEIKQIGKPVEHRGMRIPSVMSVSDIIIGLNPYVRPIYDEIVEAVKNAYRSYQ